MTATALRPGWSHPVRVAVPPLTEAGLRQVLENIQRWAPFVDGLLLDDVAAVLDDYTPTVADLVERGRTIRTEEVPTPAPPRGFVRTWRATRRCSWPGARPCTACTALCTAGTKAV